jgi:hypothetical protein
MKALLPLNQAVLSSHFAMNQRERSDNKLKISTLSGFSLLLVKGWSDSQDVQKDYIQMSQFVEQHLATHPSLNVVLKFDLVNATSIHLLFSMFRMLNKYHKDGKQIKVYWSWEDGNTEVLEIGEEFKDLYDFKFVTTQI